jgi:hypothetical protein
VCVPVAFSGAAATVVNPTVGANLGRLESWTIEEVDTDTAFNQTTGVFTVPETGNYAFYAQALLSSPIAGITVSPAINLRVNGTVVATWSPGPTTLSLLGTIAFSLNVGSELSLNTNDLVDVTVTDLTGGALTGFTLSPAVSGSGSQFYGFQIGGCAGPTGPTGPTFTLLMSSPQPFIFGKGFYQDYRMNGNVSPTLAEYSAFVVPTGAPTTISSNTIWGTRMAAPVGATKAVLRAQCSVNPPAVGQQIYIGAGENNIATQQITLDSGLSGVDYTDRIGGSPHIEVTLSTGFFDFWVTGSNNLPGTPDVNLSVTFI